MQDRVKNMVLRAKPKQAGSQHQIGCQIKGPMDLFADSSKRFGELFRWISFKHIGASTIQSRATGGVASGTYLFALPGSPGACRDAWDEILVHQLDSRFRPCSLVEPMPRLQEQLTTGG